MPFRIVFFFLMIFVGVFFEGSSWSVEASDESAVESLLSLPYSQYVETEKAPDKVGTTIYKKDKAYAGYNIYTSDMQPDGFVHLIDMDGTLVHRWARRKPQSVSVLWEQVTPFPDGSIFLSCQKGDIDWQRVDVSSYSFVIYDMPGQMAHHGAQPLKDGGFLGLVENIIRIPFQDLTLKVRDNSLVHVSPEGRGLSVIPLSKLLAKDSDSQKELKEAYNNLKDYFVNPAKGKSGEPIFDIYHANNIASLEWDIPGVAKKGDWLVTLRALDRIFIVNPEKEKIIWEWGENILSRPHHATFLEGSWILLFDNGVSKKSSRVIIVDMKSKKIVWQYGQKSGQKFFTGARGSAQRLPNGNTLVAESDNGRAFEVTEAGEVVWEWRADFFTKGELKGKRRAISRMQRLPYDFFKDVKFNYGKVDSEVRKRKKK